MNKAITATNGLPTLADWMDPLEQAVRKGGGHDRLQNLLEEEVSQVIGRLRYRGEAGARGYRHGHRARELLGTLGRVALDVPRARIVDPEGNRFEFRSVLLPRYQHLVSRAAGTDRNRSSPAQCGSGCSSGALPDA